MFEITKEISIDAGHRVPTHGSKCRHLHGHRYRVVVSVIAEGLIPDESGASDAGMVMDFGDLKKILVEVVEPYDHTLILWNQDELLMGGAMQTILGEVDPSLFDDGVVVVEVIPTAENLAYIWFEEISALMDRRRVPAFLKSVTVWETPTSSATYSV